jgi:hypothetical protein
MSYFGLQVILVKGHEGKEKERVLLLVTAYKWIAKTIAKLVPGSCSL